MIIEGEVVLDEPMLPEGPSGESLANPPMTSRIVIDSTRQWPEEGGPSQYQALNGASLGEGAPSAFALADRNWTKHVGEWRPPGY